MERLSQYRSEEQKLRWEGTFADYFELVKKNPRIARLAHARIFDMIMAAGVQPHGENEPPTYNFFASELYGLDNALRQVVDYFSSAAQRLEVRKRILLLMGPVGGGKSTIVSLLKRGLEAYTRTDEGAVYAIKGCPMHEEPLHLVPEVLRPELEREFLTADIFVYPTHITPSIVMLDAMSYGLPVVTTDVWANPELVQDGHNGLLVEHRGVSAFTEGDVVHFDWPQFRRVTEGTDPMLAVDVAEAVSRLVDDAELRLRLGQAGRREVESGRFSLRQRDAALGRLLEDAIAGEC